MRKKLKPFEEKATAFLPDRFETARIRLTILYTALLAIILLGSSVTTFLAFVAQRLGNDPIHYIAHKIETADFHISDSEEREELIAALVFGNGVLLVVGAAASYWLAGVTLEPIQKSYKRQQEFIGDASHELRTPLAIIKATTENELYHHKKMGTVSRDLQMTMEEVNRMGEMLGNLLIISRLDETSDVADKKLEDLNEIIAEAVKRLHPLAHEHGVILQFHSSSGPITVRSNKELLLQAMNNIMKNAIIYNKAQGSVDVDLKGEKSQAVLSVTDTGIGIAEPDLEHIFERFYRADKSRSRHTGGTGLGLSITQQILKNMNGSIKISSKLGHGSKVVITLPVHPTS